MPKTLVGKVAYRVLEEEANAKVGEQNSSTSGSWTLPGGWR